MPRKYNPDPIARFWEKVNKKSGYIAPNMTTECWEWTGAIAGGYGKYAIGQGKSEFAHRYSYELANGAIPDGLCVCHDCDNRGCVRPDHCFLGTHIDNMTDRKKKGLWNTVQRHKQH